jgi:hypothetical protein
MEVRVDDGSRTETLARGDAIVDMVMVERPASAGPGPVDEDEDEEEEEEEEEEEGEDGAGAGGGKLEAKTAFQTERPRVVYIGCDASTLAPRTCECTSMIHAWQLTLQLS